MSRAPGSKSAVLATKLSAPSLSRRSIVAPIIRQLAALYLDNAMALGRTFPDLGQAGERLAASTDIGNVSLALPSIHPVIGIVSLPAVNHQPEFAACCAKEAADRALFDGALGLA